MGRAGKAGGEGKGEGGAAREISHGRDSIRETSTFAK
jgi:hypothetical protein